MNITLIQWNVWLKEKPQNTLRLLKRINPDIICLQELSQNYYRTNFIDTPKYLSGKLGYNYSFAMAQKWPTENGDKIQGNGILSRYPIINSKKKWIRPIDNNNYYDYTNEGRIALLVDIKIGDKIVTVITTHLSYSNYLTESASKIEEEDTFLQLLEDKHSCTIITGDFNLEEKSRLIGLMEQKFQHVGPDYRHKTWTTKSFDHNGFKSDKLKWRLDYVFATKDINIIKSQTIKTVFSDHLPIFTVVDI